MNEPSPAAHATAFVLLAGGSGTRLARATGSGDKLLVDLGGRPLLAWSAAAAARSGAASHLVVVFRDEAHRARLAGLVASAWREVPGGTVTWVRGGPERHVSVRHALETLAGIPGITHVLVHDGARPFVPAEAIAAVAEAARRDGAAALAAPVVDTVKRVADQPLPAQPVQVLLDDLERPRLHAVQTPQAFALAPLAAAAREAARAGLAPTDDLACWHAAGGRATLVDPRAPNPKFTRPEDLPWFRFLAAGSPSLPVTSPLPFRTGIGYDIHRLVEGRRLVLGGVEIPSPLGLDGHSDADAATHALADAILAALALPDIGHQFPNTDPRWKDVDSQVILAAAVAEATARGYRVGNVAIGIIAERPRLARHVPAMREALARTLGIGPGEVGIQVTTNEGLGALGRGEGIAATATVLLAAS